MAAEAVSVMAPTASFTREELDRIREYEKIVKLGEAIISGSHPRIKVPAHLAPPSRSTSSPIGSLPTEPRPNAAGDLHISRATDIYSKRARGNAWAHGENSQQSAEAAIEQSLPGLGLAPKAASNVARLEFGHGLDGASSQRAEIETLLHDKTDNRNKRKPDSAPDLVVEDILQKARQLEQTFTPPLAAVSDNANTNSRGAATVAGPKTVSSAPADSGDDDTFYSSKFSTPEFGLTSRVPAESDNEDVCMQESSDYEPELDAMPSPKLPAQAPKLNVQQQPSHQPAAVPPQVTSQTSTEMLASLVAHTFQAQASSNALAPQVPFYQGNAQPSTGDFAAQQDGSSTSGPSRRPRPYANFTEVAYRGQPTASAPHLPTPFIRTHDLSPVAPQPEHISSLAIASHLPLPAEEQRGAYLGAPAQVAMLRREEVSQSSPDSSPQVGSRFSDKNKGKKKANGKRKADLPPTSPRIKSEPRSPSPILAPPTQRPHKRQRQEVRAVHGSGYRHDNEYNPAVQHRHVESHGQYMPVRPARKSQGSATIERVNGERYVHQKEAAAIRPVDVYRHDEHREYGAIEPMSARYTPRHAQAGWQPPAKPSPPQYAQPPPQANMRPLVAPPYNVAASGYAASAQPLRSNYPGGYATSGRASVRPDAFDRDHHHSPDMAPPPTRLHHLSPPPGRIVVDEFNREYFEPARPEARQLAVVETVAYDPSLAYERPASRQVYAPAQRYARVGSQVPTAYDEDDVLYRRTSPTFVPPRRVITQPEYVTREYVGYPQREYSTRPQQYGGVPQLERGPPILGEAPQTQDYFVRASTARPADTSRYEVPPPPFRFVERVGSVRPPESTPMSTVPVNRGDVDSASGPRSYDGRTRGIAPHMPESVYIDGHRGHEVVREYSARPEPHVVVQREYGVRPGPAPPYYTEQPPLAAGQPAQEYVYSDGNMPHEAYR